MKKNRFHPAGRRVARWGMLVCALILLCLLAPNLTLHDPNQTNAAAIRTAPCREYPFGTDDLGRCVFSRVLAAAPVSIFSALFLVAVTFAAGTVLGVLCGYFEGALDEIIMRLADVFLAFPQMILAIVVAGVLGGGLVNAMIAIGVAAWPQYARLARSKVLALKHSNYVLAAQFSGFSGAKILFRHIVPNITGSMLVAASTQLGTVMIEIAGLSFLGIGVTPPQAEWGAMMNDARGSMQLAPWAVLAPAAAMVIAIVIFNGFGDAVRDCLQKG